MIEVKGEADSTRLVMLKFPGSNTVFPFFPHFSIAFITWYLGIINVSIRDRRTAYLVRVILSMAQR